MSGLWRRMWRASLLDAELYEEVEADPGAMGQAAAVVVLSALAAAIGTIENHGVWGALWYTAAALASWYLWALVTWWIGTRLLSTPETRADTGELLRTIGFSSAPGVLRLYTSESFPSDYPDADVLVLLHRAGCRVGEIPVRMHERRDAPSMHGVLTAPYYLYKMTLSMLMNRVRPPGPLPGDPTWGP